MRENIKSIQIAIMSLFLYFNTIAQESPKNFIGVNITSSTPSGKIVTSENPNFNGLLASLFTSNANSTSGSPLIGTIFSPATSGLSYGMEAGYYFKNNFGICLSANYFESTTDNSSFKTSISQFSDLANSTIGSLASNLTQQNQIQLGSLKFSSLVTVDKWNIIQAMIGPLYSVRNGKLTFDLKLQGGIINITSPTSTASIDFKYSFVSATLIDFKQSSANTTNFAMQSGFGIRYSLHNNIALKLSADYLFSPFTKLTSTTTADIPAVDLFKSISSNSLQINIPVPQTTTKDLSFQMVNISLGLCFEFGGASKNKKSFTETQGEEQVPVK